MILYFCATMIEKYDSRGVSSQKEEVHAAIKNLSKGLYPTAFCKILPDISGGSEHHCNIMHADTAGTKTALAYVYWRETGDLSVWEGIAQDALVMNLDDMACVGVTDQFIISSTIGRNKHLVPGEVLTALIEGTYAFIEKMAGYGIEIHHSGGETADVGDIVRTVDVGITAFGRQEKSRLLINNIREGNVIVGLASFGQSSYETRYNGGMGSNGLTSARHDVFSKAYFDKYPESFAPQTDAALVYAGSKLLTDPSPIEGVNMGQLVLAPTRTYLPVIRTILNDFYPQIDGMIHCTGGGQTKVLHFTQNVHIIKDNLMSPPPLFDIIREESKTPLREMYKVFNMGHRLEVYTDAATAGEIVKIAESFQIDARIIGRVEGFEGNKLTIATSEGQFEYIG
ncbi:MAG: phosphoribosylformylglycinamidine cyclo-ligase [Sphingobacteriales bacterium BACL12 MAG-120802-bin5]|nr:MAG: phosphoribosylformylglycinamidine cyclo-ligase [Sphingobacteriales bacterium BACL12 MAG-120802-bin5]